MIRFQEAISSLSLISCQLSGEGSRDFLFFLLPSRRGKKLSKLAPLSLEPIRASCSIIRYPAKFLFLLSEISMNHLSSTEESDGADLVPIIYLLNVPIQ